MSDDATPPPPPPVDPAPPAPPPPSPAQPSSSSSVPGLFGPLSGGSETLNFGAGKVSAQDDKIYCVVAQFLSIIIWLWQRENSPAVDVSGKEALNFHITFFIISLALVILSGIPLLGILFGLIHTFVALAVLALSVFAALKTSEGKLYRYPVCLRLIK